MSRNPVNKNRERVSMYVDKEVLALFKHIAEINEVPYQPLMNKILREWYDALPDDKKYLNQAK